MARKSRRRSRRQKNIAELMFATKPRRRSKRRGSPKKRRGSRKKRR